MFDARTHWEGVYTEKAPTTVSWFEASPETSLELIGSLGLPHSAPLVDVGGGVSRLAAELVGRGYEDITVADISSEALDRAKVELGDQADQVEWVVADARDHDFGRRFAVWHDRAVFHFMVSASDRAAYVETMRRSIAPDGHLILAIFGPNGPTSCSNLPVARYAAGELTNALDGGFRLVSSRLIDHRTPAGKVQQFLYAHLRPADADAA